MIEDYISSVTNILSTLDVKVLEQIVEKLLSAYYCENKIFIMGNGGSAATASHFACDLMKVSGEDGKRFLVSSLNDNMAVITALANDIGYEYIFEEQLKDIIKKDDIVIAISASGNSKNIINAVKYAKEREAYIIGYNGFTGGELNKINDIGFHIHSNNYGIVEDIHLLAEHIVCQEVKNKIRLEKKP